MVIMLAVALLAACNSNDSQTAARRKANANSDPTMQTPADGVPRITPADLKAAVDKGTAIIVDTRAPEAYDHEHIKGAINIMEANLEAHLNELPHDKKIVAYCS